MRSSASFAASRFQHLEAAGYGPAQMRQHVGAQFFVALGFRRLALERVDLAADFFQDVEHARQILFRAFELRFGQALAGFVFADAGGFFDDGAAVGWLVGKNLADAALLDDGVAFRAEAGAHEEILNVAQAGGFAVDQVFAFARAVEAAGDGDLGGLVRMAVSVGVGFRGAMRSASGSAMRQGDLGHAERLAVAGAGEDDVFHAGAAQALGALLAEDPTDGVAEVGFSAAVRAHDGGDAGAVEAHFGAIVERLEALDIDALELEQNLALHTIIETHLGGTNQS